jgi:hypothetical protein
MWRRAKPPFPALPGRDIVAGNTTGSPAERQRRPHAAAAVGHILARALLISMTRPRPLAKGITLKTSRLFTATFIGALSFVACGGISPPKPDVDAASPDAATAPDGAITGNDAAIDQPVPDAAGDVAVMPDASPADSAAPDAGAADTRPPDGSVDTRPDSSADAGPPLALGIGRFELTGELCPEGSTTVTTSASAFTAIFSAATFAGEGAATTISHSCRLAIELQVPAGYQFSSARFGASGVALSEVPPGTVIFTDRYSFEGQRDAASFSTDLSRTNDNYVIAHRPVDLWSPSCSGNSRVRLFVDMTASVRGNDLFALDALDGAFTVPEGLQWRRCGERDPIRPDPSPRNGECAGPNQLLCQFGLICEFRGEVQELGECIDPTEVVPPQPSGEECGGHRNIPCADGLVCMFASPRSVTEKRRGWCTPAMGGEGDNCGGYPQVPCQAGLTCNPQGKRCVRDDGQLGSPCGEGLRACNAPLTCNGSSCVVPTAREGQPCGGPLDIKCRAPLMCVANVCRR